MTLRKSRHGKIRLTRKTQEQTCAEPSCHTRASPCLNLQQFVIRPLVVVGRNDYVRPMKATPDFALPVKATKVPTGPDWIHEIKYDGYRLKVIRDGDSVRLKSKSGLDIAKRFPWIVKAARKIRQTRFVLDGEAVVLGVDGVSD